MSSALSSVMSVVRPAGIVIQPPFLPPESLLLLPVSAQCPLPSPHPPPSVVALVVAASLQVVAARRAV